MTGMSALFLEQLSNNKVCIYSSFTQVLVTYTFRYWATNGPIA